LGMPDTSEEAIYASVDRAGDDDASNGMPAARAAATARDLLPVSARISALGPMNVIPACSHAAARRGFSDRNPYPGYTASAPACRATRTISSTDRYARTGWPISPI